MEPIDRRVTAARLMALRNEPGALDAIAELLGVASMPPLIGRRARREIARFIETGDATLAAQVIHASMVRRARGAGQPKG